MKPAAVLFLSLVLDLVAFAIFLPLQPKLLLHYVEKEQSQETLLGATLRAVAWWKDVSNAVTSGNQRMDIILLGGMIGSLFSLLQFLTAPLYGELADRYGRRPLLLLSSLGTVAAYVTWVYSSSFEIFLLSRTLLGLFKFNVNIWSSVVADISTPQTRNKKMAILGITFAVGFTVGPLVGAILLNRAPPTCFASLLELNPYAFPSAVATILAALDLIFLFLCFNESLPKKDDYDAKKEKLTLSINPFSMLFVSKHAHSSDYAVVKKITLLHFAFLLAFSGIEYTLGFLTWDRFGFTHKDLGYMYVSIGVTMALTSGGYVRRKKAQAEAQDDKTKVRKAIQKMIMTGMGALVPGWLFLAFSHNIWVFYIGILAMGFSSGIVVNCNQALISTYGTTDQQGILLAYARSYGALGRALGPFIFCALYWQSGSVLCHLIAAAGLCVPISMLRTLPL